MNKIIKFILLIMIITTNSHALKTPTHESINKGINEKTITPLILTNF